MLRNVDRILLRVPQLQSAVRYYQDVLGLKLLRQNPTIANFQLSDCHTELVLHTAPDLHYTPQLETIYTSYAAQLDAKPTRHEVWRPLLNMRKAGNLPKLGEAKSRPPKVSPESREHLRPLLGRDIGKRDRLPYTE